MPVIQRFKRQKLEVGFAQRRAFFLPCCGVKYINPQAHFTYLSCFSLQKSSGFVYGACALMDKLSLGFIVLALQENYPQQDMSTG